MTDDLLPTGPSSTAAPHEDVARDDVVAFDPDRAIAKLATTLEIKANIAASLKVWADEEAALRAELEAWFIETGGVTVKRHGLSLTLERRSDFRVTNPAQAAAHLTDLGRYDEVIITQPSVKLIEEIGRELEGSETPLEGCERIQSARLKVSAIAPKGDGNAK